MFERLFWLSAPLIHCARDLYFRIGAEESPYERYLLFFLQVAGSFVFFSSEAIQHRAEEEYGSKRECACAGRSYASGMLFT